MARFSMALAFAALGTAPALAQPTRTTLFSGSTSLTTFAPDPDASLPSETPRRFDSNALRIASERGVWQLWAGDQILKDFGGGESQAREAFQLFRELRVNARGAVGGVFEYYLTDNHAPHAVTRQRQFIAFDPSTLRVEQVRGNWYLRDAKMLLYNFAQAREDATKALDVCKKYDFNEMGYIGHPTPTLKYLTRNPDAPKSTISPVSFEPGSAKMQAAEALRPRLQLPGLGVVGDRIPIDSGRLDLRRERGEWALYAGREPLAQFGSSDREARAVMQSLEQFRCTELCRIGDAGFGFFLSNNRAPTGTLVGTNARLFKPGGLKVAQVNGGWAVCEADNRPLVIVGEKADDARAALEAIRLYGFDSLCQIGGGRMGGYRLFVKNR